MKGSFKFSEKILIHCSSDLAFDLTQDYSQRLSWDTFLKRAGLTGGATNAGPGVKAYCVATNGLGMVTEYITYNRPKATAIKMIDGPFMFKSFLGSWTFKDKASGCTEVIFLYSVELRFPFSLLKWLIKRNLQNNVRQRLKDLKAKLESCGTV